jgi:hypothetical protein
MKKNLLVILILTAILAIGVGIGIYAYYHKAVGTTGTVDNTITSANFNFTGDGILTTTFNDLNVAPGQEAVKYFSIHKDSPVDTTYIFDITSSGLFTGSPVKLVFGWKNSSDGTWIEYPVDSPQMILYMDPGALENEYFYIKYTWPWTTEGFNDADFAGMTGNINLKVVAAQVRDKNWAEPCWDYIYGRITYGDTASGPMMSRTSASPAGTEIIPVMVGRSSIKK